MRGIVRLFGLVSGLGVALTAVVVGVFLVSTLAFGRVPGILGPVGSWLNFEPLLARSGIELRDLEGADPRRYDPLGYYPRVVAWAGADAELVGILLVGVRADGTIDLTTKGAAHQASYTFQRVVRRPAAPAAPGRAAGGGRYGPIEIRAYRPGARRSVGGGAGARSGTAYINRGLEKTTRATTTTGQAALPTPACDLRDLWRAAIARGAPAGAVATFRYSEDGYQFWIDGTSVNLWFGGDCRMKEG